MPDSVPRVNWILILAVVAGALVAIVVCAGLIKSRRVERQDTRERVAFQHQLGDRLAPPRDRSIRLPQGTGEPAYDAIEELRKHPEA